MTREPGTINAAAAQEIRSVKVMTDRLRKEAHTLNEGMPAALHTWRIVAASSRSEAPAENSAHAASTSLRL